MDLKHNIYFCANDNFKKKEFLKLNAKVNLKCNESIFPYDGITYEYVPCRCGTTSLYMIVWHAITIYNESAFELALHVFEII